VPLDEALDFLMRVRVAAAEDSLLLSALAMQLARVLRKPQNEDPKSAAFVFMNGLKVPDGRGRQLRVVRQAIHVGMNPTGASGDRVVYSGDDTLRSATELTLQLRTIRLTEPLPENEDYSAVPWLAISLPTGISHDLFVDLD
jgi:hypothetical protein